MLMFSSDSRAVCNAPEKPASRPPFCCNRRFSPRLSRPPGCSCLLWAGRTAPLTLPASSALSSKTHIPEMPRPPALAASLRPASPPFRQQPRPRHQCGPCRWPSPCWSRSQVSAATVQTSHAAGWQRVCRTCGSEWTRRERFDRFRGSTPGCQPMNLGRSRVPA